MEVKEGGAHKHFRETKKAVVAINLREKCYDDGIYGNDAADGGFRRI